MMGSRKIVGLVLIIAFGGCVFMDTRLNIAYDPIKAEKSELSSAPSLNIEVSEFKDGRGDNIISYKNLMETGAVLTEKPMPEVMRTAFLTMLKQNGHTSDASEHQLIIGGEIKNMAMGFLPGVMTTEAVGSIVVTLDVKAPDGKVLFVREYRGEHHQRTAYATMKIWEQVFNSVLEDLMHSIATDQGLLEVFLAQTAQ